MLRRLAVLALTVLALPAQERKALLGRVVDAEHKPVADAEVTLVGAVRSSVQLLVEPDRVQVKCDQGGVFKAVLLPLAIYSGWAIGPLRSDGTRLRSRVQHGLGLGPPVELPATEAAVTACLHVDGLEDWAKQGPFRARVGPPLTLPFGIEVALDATGWAQLPPLPAGQVEVDVLQGDGQVLAMLSTSGDAMLQCAVAPRRPLPVRAVDERFQGVPGVTILQRLRQPREVDGGDLVRHRRTCWRRVAVTNAEGFAVAEVPLQQEPWEVGAGDCLLFGRKDGMADSPSGWAQGRYQDGRQLDVQAHRANRMLGFRMVAERPLPVRLLRGGRPLAGQRVIVRWSDKLLVNTASSWVDLERSAELTTDADGCLAVPGLRQDAHGFSLAVPLAANEVVVLPELAVGAQRQTIELPVVRLPLQVSDAMRGPGQRADCLLLPLDLDESWLDRRLEFRVDAAGRAQVPILPGRWLWFAADGRSAGYAAIDVGTRSEPQDLALAPLPVLHGCAVDEKGAPVAGARVLLGGQSLGDDPSRLEQAVAALARVRILSTLDQVRSDEHGRFEVPFFLPTGMDLEVRVRGRSGMSGPTKLEASSEPVPFTLRPLKY